jgi:mobilome CxxCx(11)CxxC protein
MNEKVTQIRTNALVAEYIYSEKLFYIRILSISISVLTIIVPIFLITSLFIAKSTQYEDLINIVAVIVSSILLSLTIISLIFHIDQKRENYLIGRRSNIYVANEATKLINKKDSKLEWFYNYLVEMDSKDQENIGNVSEKLKKKAYRHSLQKLFPGRNDTVCSICNASPFKYKKGSCQICGNTPEE